jgi:hypothetical protein
MSNKKNNQSEDESNKAEEPKTAYNTVHIFDSFEEEAKHNARQRAAMSYDERMEQIEGLRKRVFNQYLQPDGSWPSISQKFKIMEPYTNEAGK